MSIRCPYCFFEMELKGARAGRFMPKCAACGEKFSLLIPENPKVSPTVGKAIDEVHESLVTLATPNAATPDMTVESDSTPEAAVVSQIRFPAADESTSLVEVPLEPPALSGPPPALVASLPSTPVSELSPVRAAIAEQQSPAIQSVRGYAIIKELGTNTRGITFLARQISSDRMVVLNVFTPDPVHRNASTALLNRQVYAAAEVDHPNIAKIYDFGLEGAHYYVAREFIEGNSLAGMVDEHGKLDSEAAAGYVLQAARGLEFAHQHRLLHRDLEPEKLLLNEQGLIKIIDFGFSLPAPEHEISAASSVAPLRWNPAMGVPLFLAAEQVRGAAPVDRRTDIYSLGCTLYHLLTGRAPFMGRSAEEVFTKHQFDPVIPPEMIVRSVPRLLSVIVQKMLAKSPEQRFQSMSELIRALEEFLGVATAVTLSAKSEHAHALERSAKKFNTSGWVVLRGQMNAAFFIICIAGVTTLAAKRHPLLASIICGIMLLTPVAYQIVLGFFGRGIIFTKVRELVLVSGLIDRFILLIFAGVVLMIIYLVGALLPWLAAATLAAMIAVAFNFTVDYLVARSRRAPVEQIELLLKHMRLRGADEVALRQFVHRFSGHNWQHFFEALFGYEAMVQARRQWSRPDGDPVQRNRAHPGRIATWLDRRLAALRSARRRKLTLRIEIASLMEQGLSWRQARILARQNARNFFTAAARPAPTIVATPPRAITPSESRVRTMQDLVTTAAPRRATEIPQMVATAESDADDFRRDHHSWFRRRFGTPLDILFGPRLRFILAVSILLGFALWLLQNKGIVSVNRSNAAVVSQREPATTETDPIKATEPLRIIAGNLSRGADIAVRNSGMNPLELSLLPPLAGKALSSWNAAVAGAILLLSMFCTGRLMAITVFLAALVALFSHWFNFPGYGYPASWISAAVAAIIGFVGLLFFRTQEM